MDESNHNDPPIQIHEVGLHKINHIDKSQATKTRFLNSNQSHWENQDQMMIKQEIMNQGIRVASHMVQKVTQWATMLQIKDPQTNRVWNNHKVNKSSQQGTQEPRPPD